MRLNTRQLLEAGYFGNSDAVVQIRELQSDPHSGSGGKGYTFSLLGGLSFEVLPDRGLDIGAAWFDGLPIAWRSPIGSPDLAPSPSYWLGRFGGGLLVTCGADNIGAPRDGYGQHGSHHDTRSYDVCIQRIQGPNAPGVRITGVIDSVEIFGRRVRIYRSIVSYADDPVISISDEVTNHGPGSSQVALLYHFNFGAPLVLPGTTVSMSATVHEIKEITEAGDSWKVFPSPTDTLCEAVWQHEGFDTDEHGYCCVQVVSPVGVVAQLSWNAAQLPKLVQWIFPSRNSWALGIEPSTSPIFGAEYDAVNAGRRLLHPGQSFRSELILRLGNAAKSEGN